MPFALTVLAMCRMLAWNRSKSTTMHGVRRTSLVIPRKSRRALRWSNSPKGKGETLFLSAQTLDIEQAPAAAPTMKFRRDVIGKLLGWIFLYYRIAISIHRAFADANRT